MMNPALQIMFFFGNSLKPVYAREVFKLLDRRDLKHGFDEVNGQSNIHCNILFSPCRGTILLYTVNNFVVKIDRPVQVFQPM